MPRARRSQNASVEYTETRFRIDFFISPIGVDWRSTGRVTASFFGVFFCFFLFAIYGAACRPRFMADWKKKYGSGTDRERERERKGPARHPLVALYFNPNPNPNRKRKKQTNKQKRNAAVPTERISLKPSSPNEDVAPKRQQQQQQQQPRRRRRRRRARRGASPISWLSGNLERPVFGTQMTVTAS